MSIPTDLMEDIKNQMRQDVKEALEEQLRPFHHVKSSYDQCCRELSAFLYCMIVIIIVFSIAGFK